MDPASYYIEVYGQEDSSDDEVEEEDGDEEEQEEEDDNTFLIIIILVALGSFFIASRYMNSQMFLRNRELPSRKRKK